MEFSYDLKKLEQQLNPMYIELTEKIRLSSNARKHYAGKVEVTEILKPFSHITLDEKYKIIAYSSCETHGVFGEAVAVENQIDAPDVYLEQEHCLFQRIIPDVCYPVNEVIFCDGTPCGFFEVILLDDILNKLFKAYDRACLNSYIFSCDDVREKKDLLFEPLEWKPKYYKNNDDISKLLIFEKNVYQGVALCEYSFSNKNTAFWQTNKKYSHIEFEKGRFSCDKNCCCFSRQSVCISEKNDPF